MDLIVLLAHVPEKACPGLDPGWMPVIRKGHAPTQKLETRIPIQVKRDAL